MGAGIVFKLLSLCSHSFPTALRPCGRFCDILPLFPLFSYSKNSYFFSPENGDATDAVQETKKPEWEDSSYVLH